MKDNQTTDTTYSNLRQAALNARLQSLSPEQIRTAFNGLFRDTSDDGREVDMLLAEACIERFKEEMISRYILAPGDPYPSQPATEVQKATHYVNFNGTGLKEWVLEQVYGPIAVDAVDFKLANGIYTEEFLEAYFPGNESEKAKRRNRITTFIIPFEIGTSKMFAGGKAYDLGGLEP